MADAVAPQAPAAPDAPAPDKAELKTPEEKAEERKFKLKFGKQDREVSESEAIALAQKGWASDEKFKAAKQIEREVKEALENGDPEYMIKKKFGKNKLEWAKDVLKEELKRRAMTPEEQEYAERKSNLDKLKQEEADLINKRTQERMDAQTRHYEQQYDKELAEAMTSEGLPKNKYAASRAISIAKELVANNLEPDWKLVVKEAKRQVQEELGELIDQLTDGVGFIGEDRARKIAKALVNKGVPAPQAAKVVKQAQAEAQAGVNKPIDEADYWAKIRAKASK